MSKCKRHCWHSVWIEETCDSDASDKCRKRISEYLDVYYDDKDICCHCGKEKP